MAIKSRIKNIFCGKEQKIDDGKRNSYKTSYKKTRVSKNEILIVNEFGFTIDTQSDKSHHGGIDKAVCVYSQKYYPYFKNKYDLMLQPIYSYSQPVNIRTVRIEKSLSL